jgi:hypothetical protein
MTIEEILEEIEPGTIRLLTMRPEIVEISANTD